MFAWVAEHSGAAVRFWYEMTLAPHSCVRGSLEEAHCETCEAVFTPVHAALECWGYLMTTVALQTV